MGLRKVTHADLKYVLASGEVPEEYPDNQPYPKVLFMAQVQGEVHWYDAARWLDPWTRRKD